MIKLRFQEMNLCSQHILKHVNSTNAEENRDFSERPLQYFCKDTDVYLLF